MLGGLFDEFKSKVDLCQREGVSAAVEYIERNCAFTRRGAGGKRLEICKPIIACFDHLTSRNNDPQWHSHLLILNAAAHSDGFGTLVSKFLYDNQTAINGVYQAALATSLQRELGVTIQARELKTFEPGDTFKIDGIPDKLRDLMSSRRAEILTARANAGATTASGTEAAALATRKAKSHLPLSDLKTHWRKAAESIGVDLDALKASLYTGLGEKKAESHVQADVTPKARKEGPASRDNLRAFNRSAEPKAQSATPASSTSARTSRTDAEGVRASQTDTSSAWTSRADSASAKEPPKRIRPIPYRPRLQLP